MIFENGGSTTDLYAISEELVQGLPSLLSDPFTLDKPWTMAVNERLYAMGNARELMVCCHGSKDQGEWLLDVIWMATKQHKIVLVVESEWGRLPAIEEDFDKLLSIKSRRSCCSSAPATTREQT